MKAREWLERGLERNDPIDLLTDSWRAFNNLYYNSSGNTERDKIQSYLDKNLTKEFSKQLIGQYTKEIDYLLSQPVIDMRGNGRSTERAIEEYHNTDKNIEKLKVIFKIIYQVRCNLEHGQKSPTRERDIELCSSSWVLIAEVVDKNA